MRSLRWCHSLPPVHRDGAHPHVYNCGVEERRPAIAAGGLTGGDLLLFSLYCAIHLAIAGFCQSTAGDGDPRLEFYWLGVG